VLTLEATSPSAAGQDVYLTSSGSHTGAYTLTVYETMLLESPAIRIGGRQAASVTIEEQTALRSVSYLPQGTVTAVDQEYTLRYFENPFYAGSGMITINPTPGQQP
jgi:hypothetical protein